jgi:hypothetical protein
MKTSILAVWPLLALLGAGQDRVETREVRVYLLDRAAVDRTLKDSVAVLTLEQPSGRARTILLPRVVKETPTSGENRAQGLIRALPGTPYFVELQTGEAAAPTPKDVVEPQEQEKDRARPSGRDTLEKIHRAGVFYAQNVPASLLSGSFSATVTIRLANLTFTSEEFHGRQDVSLEDVAARVDRTLATLKAKGEETAGFMEIKPVATKLKRELGQLAPAGFEDASGDFESDRQWCLALARKIDEACDRGDSALVIDLSQQSGPRLKKMKSMLARTPKESEPVPEVPTVK